MAHVDREFADARPYLSALCAEDSQALGALMAEIHRSGRAMKVLAAMAVQALDFAHLSADRLGGDDACRNESPDARALPIRCHRGKAAQACEVVRGSRTENASAPTTMHARCRLQAAVSPSQRRRPQSTCESSCLLPRQPMPSPCSRADTNLVTWAILPHMLRLPR